MKLLVVLIVVAAVCAQVNQTQPQQGGQQGQQGGQQQQQPIQQGGAQQQQPIQGGTQQGGQQQPIRRRLGQQGGQQQQPVAPGGVGGGAAGGPQRRGPHRRGNQEQAQMILNQNVREFCTELYDALKNQNIDALVDKFDSGSEVNAFGRTFEGDQIPMAAFTLLRMVEFDNFQYEILAADDVKASCIVSITLGGQFLQTGKPLPTTPFMHVVTWGPGVVNDLTIIDPSMNVTFMNGLPLAEQLHYKMLWMLFTEHNFNQNSPLLQMLDPSIILKVHIFPSSLLPNDTYVGLQAYLQAFKDVAVLGLNVKQENIDKVEMKVLFSNENSVFVRWQLNNYMVFKNQTWQNNKLMMEEIWVATPIQPWDILTPPVPSGLNNATLLNAGVNLPIASGAGGGQQQQQMIQQPMQNQTAGGQPQQQQQPIQGGQQPIQGGQQQPQQPIQGEQQQQQPIQGGQQQPVQGQQPSGNQRGGQNVPAGRLPNRP